MTGTPAPAVPRLRTVRLLLREWLDADLAPFAAVNADPAVTEFLSAPLTRAESDAFVARMRVRWAEDGFGLWAVERLEDGAFLGFTGLARPVWAPEPVPEVGWRLARGAWGRGYPTEAATEALRFGFEDLGLAEIVSHTTVSNARSRRVMQKLGMARRDPAAPFDFIHDRLPEGHPMRPHVTYRLRREDWLARAGFMSGPDGPAA